MMLKNKIFPLTRGLPINLSLKIGVGSPENLISSVGAISKDFASETSTFSIST